MHLTHILPGIRAVSAGLKGAAPSVIESSSVLIGLLWLEGVLAPVSLPLRAVTAAVVVATIGFGPGRASQHILTGLVLAICAAVCALTPNVPVGLLAYCLGVCLAGLRCSAASPLAGGLPQACLMYVCLRFAADLVPQSRVLGEALSRAAEAYIQLATRSDHQLSVTALGGDVILAAAVFLLWRWRMSGSARRLLAIPLIAIAWFLLLPALVLKTDDPLAIFSRGASLGVLGIVVASLADAIAPRIQSSQTPAARGRSRLSSAWACLAMLAAGLVLTGVALPARAEQRSILVHNRGGLDWNRPVFGKFGGFSGGMFGLLPVYARANGYRFEVHDDDSISAAALADAQILMLINSPKEWSGTEKKAIQDFVFRGGGLLVLGDHTDVFGLMKGFNTLLDEFGIQFNFDSAYHSRHTWRGCVSAAADVVAADWERNIPQVAVGASLALESGARPLLAGRYSHSDAGLRSNVIGSFLGNYKYDPGERLGDIVLIATATYGSGRVLVFGDTSPFQGGVSESFAETIGPSFRLLSRPTGVLERDTARSIAAATLLAVAFGSWVFCSNIRMTAALSGFFFAGTAFGLVACGDQFRSPLRVDSDCFLIDRSHLPAVGHYTARMNPIGPLYTNLHRCGLRVALFDDWESDILKRAKGIAFVAPTSPFTPDQVRDLLEFEESGGVVLLVAGRPDAAAASPLLEAHELELEAKPLGTVPAAPAMARSEAQLKPRFLDAWPIVSTSRAPVSARPDIDVLYRDGKDVIAAFSRKGRGGMLLLADSRFFSTMNVEDTSGHWLGNLGFIHDVFQKHLGVVPEDVQPLFRSPIKPD